MAVKMRVQPWNIKPLYNSVIAYIACVALGRLCGKAIDLKYQNGHLLWRGRQALPTKGTSPFLWLLSYTAERGFLAPRYRRLSQSLTDCPKLRRYGEKQISGRKMMTMWLTPWNLTQGNVPSGDSQIFKKEMKFFLWKPPLLKEYSYF
jgi:hypothetical protein